MLKKNRPQLDMFDHIIFEKLVPKDHLLIKIDSIIDFLGSGATETSEKQP